MSRVSPAAMRIGVGAWAVIGTFGALAIFAWAFAQTASISVPLLIAIVLGFLFAPWVTWLAGHHIPRSLGAGIVLLGLIAVFVVIIVLVVVSLANGLSGLGDSVDEGIAAAQDYLVSIDVPEETVQSIEDSVTDAAPTVLTGVAGSVGSGLASTVATLVMIIMALYICYLMLIDSGDSIKWVGGHMGVPQAVGDEIIQDTARAFRNYFKGATLLALVTGVATTIGFFLIGAPLPVFVGIITLVMSYIPYVGAFIAGAFGVLLAYGAGGWELALYALLVVLFVQLVLQTFVQAPLIGNSLEMNPVVVFVVTMLGGTIAGALGAMLAAPFLSSILGVNRTLAKAKADHAKTAAQVDPGG